MRILVTGVAGQVCSHIADTLLEAGHHVIGVDNHLSGVYNQPKEVEFIRKDVRYFTTWPKVDAVIHGASYAELAGNWDSEAERVKLFDHNESATRVLLETMPDVPLVYLSSASVYGSQCEETGGRVTERSPLSIESPYAASKASCENYVQAWSFKRKTPWYVMRLCNQMGSRTHRGLVPDFVRKARAGHIHARDDGSQLRSWVHVKDTADAIKLLVERKAPSGTYNVASQELWSWRGLVQLMGFTGRLTCEPVKAGAIGDPVDVRLDTKKLDMYWPCKRSVKSAFREALDSLGWEWPDGTMSELHPPDEDKDEEPVVP